MSFGADTNAHTTYGETLYKIDLPEADAESIAEGLLVLRDYADGLLLADSEVQAENSRMTQAIPTNLARKRVSRPTGLLRTAEAVPLRNSRASDEPAE